MESLPGNIVVSSLIDNFKSGDITTIYGNAASGKTTTCLMAIIEAAKKNWKTIYIDTEGSFDPKRLEQLYGEKTDAVLEKLFLIQPKTFNEQNSIISKLPKLCKDDKVKLIIIDTIGIHYRLAVKEDSKLINPQFIIQMNLLSKMARELDKIIILTNQAGSRLDKKDEIRMVGGEIVSSVSRCIIELHKKDKRRYATLVKYKTEEDITMVERVGKTIEFVIENKGLFLI